VAVSTFNSCLIDRYSGPAVADTLQKLADMTGQHRQYSKNFVKWWSDTTHDVRTYTDSIVTGPNGGGKISDSRLVMVRKGWDGVRTCYKQYDENVSLSVPGRVVQVG
jgi:hypothetical protein